MILLGLDPRSSGTLAVFADEVGRILSRRTHPTLDAAAAATHDGQRPASVGIVAHDEGSVGQGVAVNPGAAIALAEEWIGAARGARHVAGLSLESSMHAGLIIDGRLFEGAHGLAGAVRWLALNPVEREDYRKLGCLEAEVGAAGIVRRLVWRIKAGDSSEAQELAGGDLNAITLQHVFEAARAGDGVAVAVVRDTAKYIGMAIANLVAMLDPAVVVVGGSIAEAGDLLLEPTRLEVLRRVSQAASRHVSVVPASLGEASAAIGAARAALASQAG
ncbi:MAG: ROK family protein [Vicinamibacterales bacterium]